MKLSHTTMPSSEEFQLGRDASAPAKNSKDNPNSSMTPNDSTAAAVDITVDITHQDTGAKLESMMEHSLSGSSLVSLETERSFRRGSRSARRRSAGSKRKVHRPKSRRCKRQERQRNILAALVLALVFMVLWYTVEGKLHPGSIAQRKGRQVLGIIGLLQTVLVLFGLCEAQKHIHEDRESKGHSVTRVSSIVDAVRLIGADVLSYFSTIRLRVHNHNVKYGENGSK